MFDFNKVKDADYKRKYFLGRPLKMSYSSFKVIEQCPARYCMANILYWTPKNTDCRNFCLGSVGHTCLERWLGEGKLALGYMQGIATSVFDEYLKKNTVIPRNRGDITEMRARSIQYAAFIEGTFLSYGFTTRKLTSETKWKVPLKGYSNVMLTGILDLHLPDDNVIYDLKMSKNANFMDRDQICYYAMMGTLCGYKTTKAGFIVPRRKDKVVEVEFSSADFRSLYDRVVKAIEVVSSSVKSGQWVVNYNKNSCYGCPVKQFCPGYKDAHKLVDRPIKVDEGVTRIEL